MTNELQEHSVNIRALLHGQRIFQYGLRPVNLEEALGLQEAQRLENELHIREFDNQLWREIRLSSHQVNIISRTIFAHLQLVAYVLEGKTLWAALKIRLNLFGRYNLIVNNPSLIRNIILCTDPVTTYSRDKIPNEAVEKIEFLVRQGFRVQDMHVSYLTVDNRKQPDPILSVKIGEMHYEIFRWD